MVLAIVTAFIFDQPRSWKALRPRASGHLWAGAGSSLRGVGSTLLLGVRACGLGLNHDFESVISVLSEVIGRAKTRFTKNGSTTRRRTSCVFCSISISGVERP